MNNDIMDQFQNEMNDDFNKMLNFNQILFIV